MCEGGQVHRWVWLTEEETEAALARLSCVGCDSNCAQNTMQMRRIRDFKMGAGSKKSRKDGQARQVSRAMKWG